MSKQRIYPPLPTGTASTHPQTSPSSGVDVEAEQVTVEVVKAEVVMATVDDLEEPAVELAAVKEGGQKQGRTVTPFERETLPGGKELRLFQTPPSASVLALCRE